MRTATARTFRRLRPSLALTASIVLLSIAIWIVVPAPFGFLLPLGVVAPEVSAWQLTAGAIVAAAAAFDIRSGRVSGAALALASITVALSIVPLYAPRPRSPGSMRPCKPRSASTSANAFHRRCRPACAPLRL